MERLSYLATFVSLILGLGVANVLANLSTLVKRGRGSDWYWVHTLWSVFLLVLMAWEWWILLHWQTVSAMGFFTYLSLLIKPSLLFFASDLLFPEPGTAGATDLKEHFFGVHRAFLLALVAYILADVFDTMLKGWDHFLDLGIGYPIALGTALLAQLAGAFTRNERVHGALVLFVFVNFGLSLPSALE